MYAQLKPVSEWDESNYIAAQKRLAQIYRIPEASVVFIDVDNINSQEEVMDIFMMFGTIPTKYVLIGNTKQYPPDQWRMPILPNLRTTYDIEEYRVPQYPDSADLGIVVKLGYEIAKYGNTRGYVMISRDRIFPKVKEIVKSMYPGICLNWLSRGGLSIIKCEYLERLGLLAQISEYDSIQAAAQEAVEKAVAKEAAEKAVAKEAAEEAPAKDAAEEAPKRVRKKRRSAEEIAAEKESKLLRQEEKARVRAERKQQREDQKSAKLCKQNKASQTEVTAVVEATNIPAARLYQKPPISAHGRAVSAVSFCLQESRKVLEYTVNTRDGLVYPPIKEK